jgi:hypothetical protein
MGALAATRSNQAATQAILDMVKWLDVKFIGFDLSSPVADGRNE